MGCDSGWTGYRFHVGVLKIYPNRAMNTGIPIPLLLALMLAACGGKDAVKPESVEKEAFEDLRAAIVEVVEDPDRQKKFSVWSMSIRKTSQDYAKLCKCGGLN